MDKPDYPPRTCSQEKEAMVRGLGVSADASRNLLVGWPMMQPPWRIDRRVSLFTVVALAVSTLGNGSRRCWRTFDGRLRLQGQYRVAPCQVPSREHLKYPVYPLLQRSHSPLIHSLANRNERDPVSHHSLSPQVMTVLSGPMSKSQLRRVQKDARRSSGMRSCSSYSRRRTTTKSH